jgi:ribonuclease P protein component
MNNTQMLKKNDFKKIYNNAPSYVNRYVVVLCIENDLSYNRLGIVASKKVGNSVKRNKARRRIREIYRLNEKDIKKGYDIVIIARMAIHSTTFADLEKTILKLLKKFKIYEKNDRL